MSVVACKEGQRRVALFSHYRWIKQAVGQMADLRLIYDAMVFISRQCYGALQLESIVSRKTKVDISDIIVVVVLWYLINGIHKHKFYGLFFMDWAPLVQILVEFVNSSTRDIILSKICLNINAFAIDTETT